MNKAALPESLAAAFKMLEDDTVKRAGKRTNAQKKQDILMESVFYAGASAVLSIMSNALDTTDADRRYSQILSELKSYIDSAH